MNSSEWEVILDYKDYESWMRFSRDLDSFFQGVYIRITDMLHVQYDICQHDEARTAFFDLDENRNEQRLFFEESWRQGKEIRQIVISLRYYQVSPTETQF